MNRLTGFMLLVATGCGIDDTKSACERVDEMGFDVTCNPEDAVNEAANSDCCDADALGIHAFVDIEVRNSSGELEMSCGAPVNLTPNSVGTWVDLDLQGRCLDNANATVPNYIEVQVIEAGFDQWGAPVVTASMRLSGWSSLSTSDAWPRPMGLESTTVTFDPNAMAIEAWFDEAATAPLEQDGVTVPDDPTHTVNVVVVDFDTHTGDQPADNPENTIE